jgi:hypothetical protein
MSSGLRADLAGVAPGIASGPLPSPGVASGVPLSAWVVMR